MQVGGREGRLLGGVGEDKPRPRPRPRPRAGEVLSVRRGPPWTTLENAVHDADADADTDRPPSSTHHHPHPSTSSKVDSIQPLLTDLSCVTTYKSLDLSHWLRISSPPVPLTSVSLPVDSSPAFQPV
jgi:hypothetical protein